MIARFIRRVDNIQVDIGECRQVNVNICFKYRVFTENLVGLGFL